MLRYVGWRLVYMLFTLVAVTLILAVMLEFMVPILARSELGTQGITDYDIQLWLEKEGFRGEGVNAVTRFWDWISGFAVGDLGISYGKNRIEISTFIWEKLGNTGLLMGLTLAFMVPTALLVGVAAGMREGSKRDRALTTVSVLSTSVPDYVSGIVLVIVFSVALNLLPSSSNVGSGDIGLRELLLPALALTVYGFGYVARMTRASMAEVMTSQYIRTAILKGLPYRRVILRHALRNALIAPFTIIVLQIPWLLTGVVAVELLFSFPGFGFELLSAANGTDVFLLMDCAAITVVVVVITQMISDIGYMLLNPRIRVR